jgi:hypothetical protein
MSDTPETDAAEYLISVARKNDKWFVRSDFARKLERERNDLQKAVNGLCEHFGVSPANTTLLAVEVLRIKSERDEAREIAAGKAYEMIEVLWSISLSDHLGDVAEAIAPILKQYGLPVMSLPALHEELKKRDLRPQWAREDD